jgi:hypothetical protein
VSYIRRGWRFHHLNEMATHGLGQEVSRPTAASPSGSQSRSAGFIERKGALYPLSVRRFDQSTVYGRAVMTRIAPYMIVLAALGLSACTNPYDPVQRGLGGGVLGAASGAAIGAAAGGGPGAALGAAIGGATGIFGGVASTPPPPPGTYFGYPAYGYPGYAQSGYGYPGHSGYPAFSGPPGYGYPGYSDQPAFPGPPPPYGYPGYSGQPAYPGSPNNGYQSRPLYSPYSGSGYPVAG